MVGNPADAEDLLQEIFLSAHRKLDGFRGESALGHVAVPAGDEPLSRLPAEPGGEHRPADRHLRRRAGLADAGSRGIADRTVDAAWISSAPLAQLPEGCRAAFLLHDVEGLEHREVAEVLGIAEGTSKSQVHKARLKLRGVCSAGGA